MNGLRTLFVPAALAVLIAVGYGAYWGVYLRGSVATDDARVEGDVVPCATRKTGRIVKLPFSEGMKVKRRDLLAQLEDADALAEVRRARAEAEAAEAMVERTAVLLSKAEAEVLAEINAKKAKLSMAKAELDRTLSGAREQEVKIARSKVEAARTRAELQNRELGRLKNLVAQKTVSRNDLERAETLAREAEENLRAAQLSLHLLETGARQEDRRMARSNLAAAEAELDKSDSRRKEMALLEAEKKMALARLASAEATLCLAENNLAETKVVAPLDAVVARVHVSEGQVVQPGQTIATLVGTESLWIQANLDEDDITAVQPGNRVSIKLDAYSGRTFQGQVESILGATLSTFSLFTATSSSGNYIKVTQRIPLRVRFLEENLPPLYPGQNAEVRIYCQ